MLEQLRTLPELSQLPDEQLQWLIDKAKVEKIAAGELAFKPGDPMDRMIILLEGALSFKIKRGNQFRMVGINKAPMITGYLPYSRGTTITGYGEAMEDTVYLSIPKTEFPEMYAKYEQLTGVLVHNMLDRTRSTTQNQYQDEKMEALGKLSAGIAHELNNPSAAIVRSSVQLRKHLGMIPERFKKVIKIRVEDEQVDAVNAIVFEKLSKGLQSLSFSDKMEREDDLLDWLEDREIEHADDMTEDLVDFGFTKDELDAIADQLREEDVAPVITWVHQNLITERLVSEIQDASQRINELVSSVKVFTHMDQSPDMKKMDIHAGLDNTLTMLGYKIRKQQIEVVKNYDESIKEIDGFPGLLNQVWTNLIDNAIFAMKESQQKKLTIETCQSMDFAIISISDTGEGIPEAELSNIFEPFFTTKEMGEGTGLGLDVVQKIVKQDHKGTIRVNSKPGNTNFEVSIPMKA